jgi:hypothetical protein
MGVALTRSPSCRHLILTILSADIPHSVRGATQVDDLANYRFTPSPVIPVNLPSSNPRQKGGSISVPQRVLTTSGAVPLPFSDGREVKVQLSALCWLTWRYKMRHPRLVVCGVFLPINPLFVMPQLSSLLFLAALSRGVSAAIGPNATLPIVNANISPDGFCRA